MSTKFAPIAFMSQPTDSLMWQFLERKEIFGEVHPLIRQCDFPVKARRFRVDIEIREKVNPGIFCRLANLYELLGLAVAHPKILCECLPIEGYDKKLEEMGDEIGTDITIPIISFSDGRFHVKLVQPLRQNEARYLAVITSVRRT